MKGYKFCQRDSEMCSADELDNGLTVTREFHTDYSVHLASRNNALCYQSTLLITREAFRLLSIASVST